MKKNQTAIFIFTALTAVIFFRAVNIRKAQSLKQFSQMPPDSSAHAEYAAAEYRKISPEEAYEMMRQTEDFILLDVRTESEYRERRIEGARLLPDNEIEARAETELTDKSAPVFIYCRSGRRSEKAAKALVDMGYTEVYDFGGIIEWTYETISD